MYQCTIINAINMTVRDSYQDKSFQYTITPNMQVRFNTRKSVDPYSI